MTHLKIQKTKAPKRATPAGAPWRDMLTSMGVGHWFTIHKSDYQRTAAACSAYLKGRYSLRKHPTKADVYVVERTK